ncbi:Hom end-associated Hint [Mariniflexile rhizosphaerae]|uniref:Hint domain-containing protein n=1 Tax=unclassified Mariniflexile TaxID=2643887 RepID=UPI000E32DDF1|nr:Hint domain-containing protein [Mariniflexile sp. TRM1-10]AXP80837.1 Hom end-associated Hint [Mariniflexile sp. TRM1-10]
MIALKALETNSDLNKSLVYVYGTAEISAAKLTLENTARMTRIAGFAKGLGTIGNIAGMIPATNDMLINGNVNGDNFVDFMISGTAFAPGGWILAPVFQLYANDVRNDPNKEKRIKMIEMQTGQTPMSIGANCFAEGSQVLMGDGTTKNIEFIQVGDAVLTYDFIKEKMEINLVLKVDNPIHHKLVKVVFSNGEEIISTEDHPYYVKDKG